MSEASFTGDALIGDIRQLIDAARQRASSAVNAELTLLYWQVGRRIGQEILGDERAEYGKQVISSLSRRLTAEYGGGWSEKQLRHCLRLAETFPDEQIVSAVRRQLSWTHLKTLIYLDDPLKRNFYMEMSRLEGWSSRRLRERIDSMLFERSAISKQPEETIGHELERLRATGQPSSDLLDLEDAVLRDAGSQTAPVHRNGTQAAGKQGRWRMNGVVPL